MSHLIASSSSIFLHLPLASCSVTTTFLVSEKPLRFCKSVDFRPLRREAPNLTGDSCSTLPSTPVHKKNPPLPTMSSGGSRFKVVPVETRYKRDRWTCVDYYDSLRDPYFSPNGKHAIAKPTAAIKSRPAFYSLFQNCRGFSNL
nr:hypothetical protein C30G4.4 - Caenorhabditis elegans [Caenorhabditis elegans]